MVTLTSAYQYIGRSNAVTCPSGWKFYCLIYAKTAVNSTEGTQKVSVLMRMVCDVKSSFYQFATTGSATVDGASAFSWSRQPVPNAAWNTTSITAGGVTYPRWIDLKEGSVTVDTGFGEAKTVTIASSWVMNGTSTQGWVPYNGAEAKASLSAVLPEIPGASKISMGATVQMGSRVTISLKNYYDTATNTLTYSFGTKSGTIDTGVKDSAQWDIPLSLASEIPDKPSGEGTVFCTTYNNGNLIGTSQFPFTAAVPDTEETRPKVNVTIQPVHDLPEAFSGLYLTKITKVRADFTASSDYSTIASYTMTVDGKTVSGNPAVSDVLATAVKKDVTLTVTDARGYSTTVKKDITAILYDTPTVVSYNGENAVVCRRCDHDGNPQNTGTSVLIKAGRSYSQIIVDGVQRNLCSLKYRFGKAGVTLTEDDWVTLLAAENTGTDSAQTVILNGAGDIMSEYTVEFLVKDTVGNSYPLSVTVPAATTPLHLGKSKKNIGIGMFCDYTEDYRADVGWKTYFHEAVNMGGNQITGIANPFNSSDAVPLGYAQNAFSPAAYGFGNFVPIPLDSDLNDYYNPGAYGIQSNEIADSISNIPEAKSGILYIVNAAGMNTIAGTWKYARQIYIPYSEAGRYYVRTLYKGSTEEWIYDEWEVNNPPMAVGVEYRTTERFMGKPVYAKLVSLGAAPNSAYKTVSGCYSGAKYAISCTGIASKSSGYQLSLPTFDNAGKGIGIWAYANGNIAICANYNASAYTICYALVKYIKN